MHEDEPPRESREPVAQDMIKKTDFPGSLPERDPYTHETLSV
jgi:hypothetical protein